jgi:hypothetical protein
VKKIKINNSHLFLKYLLTYAHMCNSMFLQVNNKSGGDTNSHCGDKTPRVEDQTLP